MFTTAQEKALAADKHISLTANAGSGKTYVLTNRYLKIAAENKVPLHKIVAITYTELAAAELYKSIADGIQSLVDGAVSEDDKQLYEDLRKELVSANVSTIHSFCSSLLREFPAEAGLDPNFKAIDEYSSRVLTEESIMETFAEEKSDLFVSSLSALLGGQFQLKNTLAGMIAKRENLVHIIENLYAGDAASTVQILEQRFVGFLMTQLEAQWNQSITLIKRINTEVLSAANKNERAREIDAILCGIQVDSASTKNCAKLEKIAALMLKKDRKDLDKSKYFPRSCDTTILTNSGRLVEFFRLNKLLADACDADGVLRTDDFTHSAKSAHELIFLFKEILAKYDKKKQSRGELDFTDMIVKLRELLKNDTVLASLAARFDYIMVDEYQDTNEMQYEIFLPLLNNLQRGNLFVVGDEKQSIYMFRNADLEIVARTKDEIRKREPDGSVLVLPDSFRMAPRLCLFINILFETLFAEPNPAYNEVAHEETICAYGEQDAGTIEALYSNPDAGSPALAELIARRILQLKQESPAIAWKDIAILCARRNFFFEFQTLLPRHNIPYFISGSRGFYQSQFVYDVYNYVAFLANSGNDVALTGVLRSPFYFISDSELLNLSTEQGQSLYQKLLAYAASRHDNNIIRGTAEKLKKHILLAGAASMSAVIDAIMKDTHYLSVAAARTDGEQILANYQKLRRQVMEFEQLGFKNLYDYAVYLDAAIESEADEADAPLADSPDAVQIMTIHAAKGLQFRAVFIYRMEYDVSKRGGFDTLLLDKSFGLLAKIPGSVDYFAQPVEPAIYQLAKEIRKRKESAERKRLLYVALTRARQYLFLCAEKPVKNYSSAYWSLLQTALNYDETAGRIALSGTVKRLLKKDNEYTPTQEDISFNIPIISGIAVQPAIELPDSKIPGHMVINTRPIPVSAQGVVITASHFTTFIHCPLSYYLTHILKIGDWDFADVRHFEKPADDDGFGDEPLLNVPAIKGVVLHRLLESGAAAAFDDVKQAFALEAGVLFDEHLHASAINDIADLYSSFRESAEYREIVSCTGFRSELKVTAQHKGAYLQGRIDRLLLQNDSVIIVDYKSGAKINEAVIESYSWQMNFYALLARALYPAAKTIETWLVFLHEPDRSVRRAVLQNDFSEIERRLSDMMEAFRTGTFVKREENCGRCNFAKDHSRCAIN